MKIAGNRLLFESWLTLGNDLMTLRYLFQNDGVDVTPREISEWKKKLVDWELQVQDLAGRSLGFLHSFAFCKPFVILGYSKDHNCWLESSYDFREEAEQYLTGQVSQDKKVTYKILDLRNVP